MAVLKEPKYAVVLRYGFPSIVEVDWETEKSFGRRGYSVDCVRYTRSTGEMYSKSEPYRMFDTSDEAVQFHTLLNNTYYKLIEQKKEEIRELEMLMRVMVKN